MAGKFVLLSLGMIVSGCLTWLMGGTMPPDENDMSVAAQDMRMRRPIGRVFIIAGLVLLPVSIVAYLLT